jgi:hypothetical protein
MEAFSALEKSALAIKLLRRLMEGLMFYSGIERIMVNAKFPVSRYYDA